MAEGQKWLKTQDEGYREREEKVTVRKKQRNCFFFPSFNAHKRKELIKQKRVWCNKNGINQKGCN